MYKIVRTDGRIEVTTLHGIVVWELDASAWIVFIGRDGSTQVEMAGTLEEDVLLLALAQKVDLSENC